MKLIKLTQEQFAQVDDWNYNWLNQWHWIARKDGTNFYAYRHITINEKKTTILMHRLIMNPPKGLDVDHIDHNGLNCQEYNMRNCTRQQNLWNAQKKGISKYKGVRPDKKRFQALIYVNKKQIILGQFRLEKDAARAYDQAAKLYFGEFANLNFK